MKKAWPYLLLLFFSGMRAEALSLQNNVTVRTCEFLHPEQGSYLESSITIGANALTFIADGDGNFQASVQIQIIVYKADLILASDKYILHSPLVQDTSNINFSIIEEKRLFIPEQVAALDILISDVNDPGNVFRHTEAVVPIAAEGLELSGIQFVDSYKPSSGDDPFTKNGYSMQPWSMNYFPTEKNTLILYGELYHSDEYFKTEPFLITFDIRSPGSGTQNPHFYQYIKYEPAPVISFLREIDISSLPSGNFDLVVEVRDKSNTLITQERVPIQRENEKGISALENLGLVSTDSTFVDGYTQDQLNYYLDVIRPQADGEEKKLIESLLPRDDPDMKKKFLYNFWLTRNNDDPYAAWLKYLDEVKTVNTNFGTPSKAGYKTDRGRVYLQYGPPYDMVSSVNESGAYPYEIWYYNTLPDKETNIGFAFYDPSLVSNDYVLLHSNARGEFHDPRWKVKIYENVASPSELGDYDITTVTDKLSGQRVIDMYDF